MQLQLPLHHTTQHYTTLQSTTKHYTTLYDTTIHDITLHYATLLHHKTTPTAMTPANTQIILHLSDNSTTLQLQLQMQLQLQLHYTTLHAADNTTPSITTCRGISASLCHPWFTTTNLSYRFSIFYASATTLCGDARKYRKHIRQ